MGVPAGGAGHGPDSDPHREDNADLIQAMFDRDIAYLRGMVAGWYVVANCSTAAELGERAAATARRMMQDVLSD